MICRLILVCLLLVTFAAQGNCFGFFKTMAKKVENFFSPDEVKKSTEKNNLDDDDKKACFKRVGCFSIGIAPWNRPNEELPQSPEKIGIKLALYNRQMDPKDTVGKSISEDEDLIKSSGYDGLKQTIIIIHNVHESAEETWVHKMRRRLLYVEDCQVITVNWENGAVPRLFQRLSGFQPAIANVRTVGAVLEKMVLALEMQTKVDRENFHCIGFGLGAHACGELGRRIRTESKRLGRISGLDPWGKSGFENQDPKVRLDSSDAWFVDVIHTDSNFAFLKGGAGNGAEEPMGHVDFYPNSGRNQPGCTLSSSSSTMKRNLLNCASAKAVEFFIESIYDEQGCQFISIPCEDHETFERGACTSCGVNGCARMGYHAPKALPSNYNGNSIKYFLITPKEKPYCVNPYHFFVKVNKVPENVNVGKLSIVVRGLGGETDVMDITLDKKHFDESQQAYKAITTDKKYIRKPTAINMKLSSHYVDGLQMLGVVVTAGYAENKTTHALFRAGTDKFLRSQVAEESFVKKYILKKDK